MPSNMESLEYVSRVSSVAMAFNYIILNYLKFSHFPKLFVIAYIVYFEKSISSDRVCTINSNPCALDRGNNFEEVWKWNAFR